MRLGRVRERLGRKTEVRKEREIFGRVERG